MANLKKKKKIANKSEENPYLLIDPNFPALTPENIHLFANGGGLPSEASYTTGIAAEGRRAGGRGFNAGNAASAIGGISGALNAANNPNPNQGTGENAWDTTRAGVAGMNPIFGAFDSISQAGQSATANMIGGEERGGDTAEALWDPFGGVMSGIDEGDTPKAIANAVGLGMVESQFDLNNSNERAAEKRAKALAANQEVFDDSGVARIRANGGPVNGEIGLPGMQGDLDITTYEGNTHEAGGISIKDDVEVEGGETRVEDYIFSDRLRPEGSKKTFSDIAKQIERRYDRKDDAATTRAMKKEYNSLMALNEIARQDAEAAEQEEGQADVFAYGGHISRRNGGIHIAPDKRIEFIAAAKERGLGTQEFAGKIMSNKDKYNAGGKMEYKPGGSTKEEYANGGALNELDPNSQFGYDPKMFGSQYGGFGQGENQGFSFLPDDNNFVNGLELMDETDISSFNIEDEYSSPSLTAGLENNRASDINLGASKKKSNFNNEDLGFAASMLPSVLQFAQGQAGPETTKFDRLNSDTISLQGQRDESARQTAISRNIARENARRSGSSGQYLSNIAANNAALSESKIRSDLQSYLQEENVNTRIKNQANQINVDISNKEIIANEQNAAMADRFKGTALSDMSQSIQGYTKDKGLSSENERYNKQVLEVINANFRNYKWGVDPQSDTAMITFANNKIKNNGK